MIASLAKVRRAMSIKTGESRAIEIYKAIAAFGSHSMRRTCDVSGFSAENIQNNGSEYTRSAAKYQQPGPMIFAGSLAVCQANYNQCVRGCDGFAQCIRQCQINYNGCLR